MTQSRSYYWKISLMISETRTLSSHSSSSHGMFYAQIHQLKPLLSRIFMLIEMANAYTWVAWTFLNGVLTFRCSMVLSLAALQLAGRWVCFGTSFLLREWPWLRVVDTLGSRVEEDRAGRRGEELLREASRLLSLLQREGGTDTSEWPAEEEAVTETEDDEEGDGEEAQRCEDEEVAWRPVMSGPMIHMWAISRGFNPYTTRMLSPSATKITASRSFESFPVQGNSNSLNTGSFLSISVVAGSELPQGCTPIRVVARNPSGIRLPRSSICGVRRNNEDREGRLNCGPRWLPIFLLLAH